MKPTKILFGICPQCLVVINPDNITGCTICDPIKIDLNVRGIHNPSQSISEEEAAHLGRS